MRSTLHTTVTDELIDSTYDALTIMSLFGQRLSEGEVSDNEASEMSWMLGSIKRRLEPVISVLELIQTEQLRNKLGDCDDLIALGDEILALNAKVQLRCRGLKEKAE